MKAQSNESQYITLPPIREQIKEVQKMFPTSPHKHTVIGRLSQQDKNILLKEGNRVIEVNNGGVYLTTIEWD